MLIFRLLKESFIFAIQAIVVNKLRTILSLLGITIGIFAIVSVFTVIDSLRDKIQTSIDSLGDNVLFIQKWPWVFSDDFQWWKYMNRPNPTVKEHEELRRRTKLAEESVYVAGSQNKVEYINNNVEGASLIIVSNNYDKVMSINISKGRFFSEFEYNVGKEVAVIGSEIVSTLFEDLDPIGKRIKIMGRKAEVIGILKEGDNTFGKNQDNCVYIPVNFGKDMIDLRSENAGSNIIVKAKPHISNEQLADELTGIMRSIRKLKPSTDNNFSINETSLLTKGIESIFNVISLAGWLIGGFSIIVGGFGIANIMFVPVRERTNIIGIQKSLGAKNYFILLQFLFEAIVLCLIGGALGLLLIYIGTAIVTNLFDFKLALSLGNIIFGLFISAIIGLVSGLIPAFMASRLNPVDAIRMN